MLIEMDYSDISVFLKALGYDDCDILASYVEDCCCDGWNIKQWVANADYKTFETKEEALEYIESENMSIDDDCSIYECEYCKGVFLDLY